MTNKPLDFTDKDKTVKIGITQRSLKFLTSLKKENHQFAVIGLGRFGSAVSSTLYHMGYQVLATDIDKTLVSQAVVEKIASDALQLDSTDPLALKESGIFEFDTVIVAIGNYLEESIVTTLNLKEAGVSHIVAKASSEIHGKLLRKVGADEVIFPEHEAGVQLAHTLTKPSILDRFDIDPHHSIVEILIPEKFNQKTILELELRNKYGLNVLAVGDGESFDINPIPQKVLQKGLIMIVIGSNDDIKRLPLD
jgi:trk system potassium uptake protein